MLAIIKTILILIFLFFYIVIAVGVGVKLGLKSLLDDFVIVKNKGEGEKNEERFTEKQVYLTKSNTMQIWFTVLFLDLD